VGGFGGRVALVEPGDVKSRLWDGAPIVPSRFEAYERLREQVVHALSASLAHADDPRTVAERIVRVAETDAPALHHRVGKWANLLPRMKAWMPERMFENGVRKRFMSESAPRPSGAERLGLGNGML